MADEATRILSENYRDIPVNIESVKEPGHKAIGTGTGLWLVIKSFFFFCQYAIQHRSNFR